MYKRQQQAYDALTEYEKSLVGSELKVKLEAAQKALEEAKNAEKQDDMPGTYDGKNLTLYIVLAAVAAAVIAVILISRKRRTAK